jgi:hypothetical protein
MIASLALYVAAGYLVAGIVFAAAFLTAGVGRVDPQTIGAGLPFRLIIAPGVIALWPILLRRWMKVGAS